jgi:hypothetical protein
MVKIFVDDSNTGAKEATDLTNNKCTTMSLDGDIRIILFDFIDFVRFTTAAKVVILR